MADKFLVEDAFTVRNSTVLALDKKWFGQIGNRQHIDVDGERLPFTLTHNEYWILVPGEHLITGKTIKFVN